MTDQMHMEQYVVGMVATNCYLIYHTQTKEALLIDPGAEAQRLMDEMARLKVTPVAGDTIVEIRFDRVGVKKTMANYAPLTKLEEV